MAKVEVLTPFRVVDDGKTYTAGDVADVTDTVAAHWQASGWAKPAETKTNTK